MSRFRDRTEDFKDSVRKSAVSIGYDESKLASTMASFIIHKPKERSPFAGASFKTLESIRELDQFMLKHRKDYVDLHRTTKQEKDSIEQEIAAFIKACREQIDILEKSVSNEEANSKGWFGLPADNSNDEAIKHKRGQVSILREKLESVNAQFKQLEATRFKDTINRAMPRRKHKRAVKEANQINTTLANLESIEPEEIQAQPRRVQQQQLLDDETQALEVELSNLLDGASQIENKMEEISGLTHLSETLVLKQAQQSEFLYDQAGKQTYNLELGNKWLSQANKHNSSSRTFLLLFFVVLTFSVLFLDWYS